MLCLGFFYKLSSFAALSSCGSKYRSTADGEIGESTQNISMSSCFTERSFFLTLKIPMLDEFEKWCGFMDLPGGLSMRRGSSERKNAIITHGEAKSTDGSAEPNVFTWFFKSHKAHNTVVACFYRKLGLHSSDLHGNKISMTFSLSARRLQKSRKPWTEMELEWVSVYGRRCWQGTHLILWHRWASRWWVPNQTRSSLAL